MSTSQPVKAPAPAELLDILPLDALCRRLGVDAKTVYRWRRLRARPLPSFQPTGGRLLFSWRAVEEWIRTYPSRPARYSARAKRRRASAGMARATN